MSWLSRLWPWGSTPARQADAAKRNAPPERIEPVALSEPFATPADAVTTSTTPAAGAGSTAATAATAPPASRPVLAWLLGCGELTDTPITPVERQALDTVARMLAQPEIPDNLLPRAAALIPQLIALVRQTDLPTPAIADRIGKDAVLAAEVMRLASSPYYRVQGSVRDLEQAIALIGLQGLQTVIARVLLKPIYRSPPGPLSGRAGTRMWDHSEALARHTAILADPAGQSVFDGYLAGMLHDTGWTVAFSIIDRANLQLPVPPSQAFGAALTEQMHPLFGLAAQRWEITPGFTALAQDARNNSLTAARHPLAHLLRQAQQIALDELDPVG